MRYFIVAWDQYYPSGGLRNIKDKCSDMKEARESAQECCENWDNVEIYDSNLELVETIK